MDKLAAMRTFAGVVERGSFAAAANAFGTTRSAVSKQVGALESSLGVRLLNRTTRKVSLTEVGWAYYERVLGLLQSLDEAEVAVSSLQSEPKGILRINAPMSFGTLYLGSAIADFMAKHSELQVQLTLNDRLIDPIAEGADVTVRIGALEDSSFIARKIAPARVVICAAPAYLRRMGRPLVPADLAGHDCLVYGHVAAEQRWKLRRDSKEETVPVRARLCANNGEVVRAAAVRGLGIAALPTFIAGEALRRGELEPILEGWTVKEIAIYALYAPNRYLAAKVRLFIDFLVERFGETPKWDACFAHEARGRAADHAI